MGKVKKVLFISSGGGHLYQLMQLDPLIKEYNSLVVTEYLPSTQNLKTKYNTKYLLGGNRRTPIRYFFTFIINFFISFKIFLGFYPDFILTTGVHTAIPMCYIARLFNKKIIYIETIAKVTDRTVSGRIIYPIADLFLVQWENMLNLYPKAKYLGGLY